LHSLFLQSEIHLFKMFKQLHSHDGPCHSFKEDPSSCEWVCLVLCQKPSTAFFWNWILDDILVLQNHQLQSESAIGLLDKQSSIHVQGRLSESPEVRERLERLVSDSTKRPSHARSDSAGSLRMASHVSNIINFEQAYNKVWL
jgi:hypothetical protein